MDVTAQAWRFLELAPSLENAQGKVVRLLQQKAVKARKSRSVSAQTAPTDKKSVEPELSDIWYLLGPLSSD